MNSPLKRSQISPSFFSFALSPLLDADAWACGSLKNASTACLVSVSADAHVNSSQ